MKIIAKCPQCQTTWELDSEAVDRRITCSQCHLLFKVPGLKEIPKAARVLHDAQSTVFIDEDGRTYG